MERRFRMKLSSQFNTRVQRLCFQYVNGLSWLKPKFFECLELKTRQNAGANHLTKISGSHFRNFRVSNRTPKRNENQVQNGGDFEIADSKWLKNKIKGNGFSLRQGGFEMTELEATRSNPQFLRSWARKCVHLSLLFKSFLVVLDLTMGASGGAIFPLSSKHKFRKKKRPQNIRRKNRHHPDKDMTPP